MSIHVHTDPAARTTRASSVPSVQSALPSLSSLSIGTFTCKREADARVYNGAPRKQAKLEAGKREFFSWDDFLAWKALVLAELQSDAESSAEVHRIAGKGALPIRSKSNNWFGVDASNRYRGQPKPPDDLKTSAERNKWRLIDLLNSNQPMMHQVRDEYNLLGSRTSSFRIMLRNNLVLDPNSTSKMSTQRKMHLYINNLYPRETPFEWLRGGDLLYAAGIVFSLVDVDYLSVCEGPDVRNFERPRRDPSNDLYVRDDYFYYDKTILAPPKHVESMLDCDEIEGYDSSDDETFEDQEEHGMYDFYRTRPTRDIETTMACWIWEKPDEFRYSGAVGRS